MHTFDKAYWEDHWAPAPTAQAMPVNPYLLDETRGLRAGTALDAGCGTGTEALWLAEQCWRVTGADISATALKTAADRADAAGLNTQVEWIETDVARWQPGRTWDLVITNYAHPDTGQLEFYQHIASWVSPGGTLLIVGHLPGSGHGHDRPESATATPSAIADVLTEPEWSIRSQYDNTRSVQAGDRTVELHDAVVRAQRAPRLHSPA